MAGIGKVLEYEAYVQDEASLKSVYNKDGLLHFWIVTREATANNWTGRNPHKRHRLGIHGLRVISADEQTEKTHQELVEAVCDKLNTLVTANGRFHLANGAGIITEPAEVEFVNKGLVAKKLCWYGKIALEVQEVLLGP